MEKKTYNLTFPQQNILFMERFNKDTSVNVISGLVNIDKEFSEELCKKAINEVIEKNIAMRTRVIEDSGEFLQYFADYNYEEIEIVDMSSFSKEKILEYMDGLASQSLFALDKKLYDYKIFKYSEDKGSIFMRIHHIISDAWSCGKMGTQLIKTLQSYKEEGEVEELPSYIDFITSENEYKTSEKYVKDEEFWKEYLNGINETVSLKETVLQGVDKAKRYSVKLEKEFNDKILAFCKENRVSPYALFLSAVSTYIYRVKDKNDFVLGTPVLNRSNFKEKQMLGMFVSTLPLRIKVEENENFLELTKKIAKDTLSVFRHQKFPYMKTLESIRKESDIKTNLYNIVLSYQNARTDVVDPTKYSTGWAFSNALEDELQIHIMDMDDSGILNINYDYKSDLFEDIEIEYLHTRILAIIENAIDNLEVTVEDIRIMSREEENKILYEFNDTKTDYPKDKTVIELFEEQVKKTPEAVALVFENKQMTYKELFNKVRSFASRLEHVNDENIIVCLENSLELIISIYGILMSGNCYVPIDVTTPIDRIKEISKDCNCKYVVMKDKLVDNVEYIDFSINNDNFNSDYKFNKVKSNNLAYMIYTSGSTGIPKGVKITHRSLINYITWASKSYVNDYNPVMPLYSSIGFDLTVTTLYLPIICGGTIIIYNNNSDEILRIFKEDRVNLIKLTPAHLALVNEANINVNNIKNLILGGEALKTNDVKKVFESNNGNISIFNEYGPTEATVGCMIYKYNKNVTASTIPIGVPADNVQMYTLDKKLKLCPLGIEGEIYIQGDGISIGYNNLPQKNMESFINSPFEEGKMYRTGDIGKLNFDLNLIYIGRKDKQVKINGNRIELEEIENIAAKLFNFDNVVVDVKNISNIPNICLYYVSKDEYQDNEIREKISEKLPHYMVPSKYIKIDKIPLNPNGKVVRSKLPLPKNNNTKDSYYINELEEIVCNSWREIIEEKITPEDNIFDFGVDSLNIIRCQVKLSNYINVVDIQQFYRFPVIRDFCNNITNKKEIIEIDENLNRYREINFQMKYDIETNHNDMILLGATGYLGIHILKNLLTNNNVNNIYCIVRGANYDTRLRKVYEYYHGSEAIELYNEKVKVINGDMKKENFGLSYEEIDNMVSNSRCIINAAAIVKHYGNYLSFESINVKAVENIAKICEKYNLVLQHISTISIAGDSKIEKFDETKFYIGQNFKINPYIETKFNAEKYIYEEIEKNGLKANVYRIGNLTWRYSDGKYQNKILENGFFMRIKNILHLNAFPSSLKHMKVEMTPVDIASDFVTTLVINAKYIDRIYHIYNPTSIDFLDMITHINPSIRELSDEDFMKLLKSYDSRENVLLNDIISSIGTLDVELDNAFTINELKNHNKKWPILDNNYINKMCIYLKGDENK